MKLIIIAAILLAACSAPVGVASEPLSSPPVMCGPNGSCPAGLLCADDNHCGQPCGVDFSCSLGWYCYAHGAGNRDHDCVPAGSCVYADGGC